MHNTQSQRKTVIFHVRSAYRKSGAVGRCTFHHSILGKQFFLFFPRTPFSSSGVKIKRYPFLKRYNADQASAMVTTIAATPRIIPIMAEMPVFPVAFRNQTSEITPSTMAPAAKMPVSITHERTPRARLTKPGQFLVRFGAFDGASCVRAGIAPVTGG